MSGDIEEGGGRGKRVVEESVYREAESHALTLGETVRTQTKEKKELARAIDVLRQLVLVGTGVVIILLIIVALVDHPTLQFSHKHFAIGGLVSVCTGFAVSVWLAKGSPVVMIMLVSAGIGSFAFALGYVVCELRHI